MQYIRDNFKLICMGIAIATAIATALPIVVYTHDGISEPFSYFSTINGKVVCCLLSYSAYLIYTENMKYILVPLALSLYATINTLDQYISVETFSDMVVSIGSGFYLVVIGTLATTAVVFEDYIFEIEE